MKTELTIEQSAKLIELGVDRKLASIKEFVPIHPEVLKGNAEYAKPWGWFPKFTLTDILSILPKEVIYNRVSENLTIFIDNNKSTATYPFYNSNDADFESPELIDSLYQLLIWTITNGYLNQKKK